MLCVQDLLDQIRCGELEMKKVGKEKGERKNKIKPQKERGKTFRFTNH